MSRYQPGDWVLTAFRSGKQAWVEVVRSPFRMPALFHLAKWPGGSTAVVHESEIVARVSVLKEPRYTDIYFTHAGMHGRARMPWRQRTPHEGFYDPQWTTKQQAFSEAITWFYDRAAEFPGAKINITRMEVVLWSGVIYTCILPGDVDVNKYR